MYKNKIRTCHVDAGPCPASFPGQPDVSNRHRAFDEAFFGSRAQTAVDADVHVQRRPPAPSSGASVVPAARSGTTPRSRRSRTSTPPASSMRTTRNRSGSTRAPEMCPGSCFSRPSQPASSPGRIFPTSRSTSRTPRRRIPASSRQPAICFHSPSPAPSAAPR